MYIWDNYKDEYNKLDYPSKVQIEKDFEHELETFVGTKKELEAKEQELNEKAEIIFKNAKADYYNKQNEIYSKYVKECYEQYNYPKIVLDKAWNMAYSQGHSSGYYEVENIFDEIVDDYMEVYNAGKNGVE